MRIIGAGIAGLLAANMLRHKNPIVIEKQKSLPNNHTALLRFRAHIVGDVTGVEFKKVQVIKATHPWKNPVADALAYAKKNTGTYLSNRSIPTEVISVERYIAPPDLVARLATGINFKFEDNVTLWQQVDDTIIDNATISTIPMPALMDLLDYKGERPIFSSINGTNIHATVEDCDAYVSLYVPSPFYPFSRVSITGNDLIAEIPREVRLEEDELGMINSAAALFGISADQLSNVQFKRQKYAKIRDVDDGLRKRFIAWASDEFGIYSLGRFATWRPGLLLDDLVQDVRLIERWMNGGAYGMRRHR